MALREGVGRAVFYGALGVGAAAGVTQGLTDYNGYTRREILPTAQQIAFNNPRMIQESMRYGIEGAFSSNPEDDVNALGDYYYSRPVNLRGNSSLGIPVSGEMVFGMYNLRR